MENAFGRSEKVTSRGKGSMVAPLGRRVGWKELESVAEGGENRSCRKKETVASEGEYFGMGELLRSGLMSALQDIE